MSWAVRIAQLFALVEEIVRALEASGVLKDGKAVAKKAPKAKDGAQ
jgi:hypothetical protein